MGERTPHGKEHSLCPLFSSAALIIRSFTAENFAKENLDILEGMDGQKKQGKTTDANK